MKKLFLLLLFALPVVSYTQTVSLEEASAMILARHPSIESAELEIKKQSAMRGAAFDLPKTDVMLLYGQYNSAYRNDNNITITQRFPFPVLFTAQHRLAKSRITAATSEKKVISDELIYQLRTIFNDVLFMREMTALYVTQDSLNRELVRIARLKYATGEGASIHVTSAEAYSAETTIALQRVLDQHRNLIRIIAMLCEQENIRDVSGDLKAFLPLLDTTGLQNNAALMLQRQKVTVSAFEKRSEMARALPDIQLGYFNQTLVGNQNISGTDRYFSSQDRFDGFQVGVSLPLVFGAQRARIRSAGYATALAEKDAERLELELSSQFIKAKEGYEKNNRSALYYEQSALPFARLLLTQSVRAFQSGEIDYTSYIQNMKQALSVRESFLTALHARNADHITILLLTGN